MKKDKEQVIRSWSSLNDALMTMTEQDVEQLLRMEQRNKNRDYIIRRLHQRLSRLRANRERRELADANSTTHR